MSKNIVCFGEILWDDFPTGKVIGGAPFNVANRLHSLGNNSVIVSRIGDDADGEAILKSLVDNNIPKDLVQVDKNLPTGLVTVNLDKNGSPTYDIVYPAAWDKIELNEDNQKAVKQSNAFVFGSLVCRDGVSKDTLLDLLPMASYKVFDINLRSPYYSFDLIFNLMQKADMLKLNDEELIEVCEYLNSPFNSINENISFLAKETNTNEICVTKGAKGAVFFQDDVFYDQTGFPVIVEDTVGAGDSFLASFLSFYLNENDIQKALQMGCAYGAAVASKKGANPKLDDDQIATIIGET